MIFFKLKSPLTLCFSAPTKKAKPATSKKNPKVLSTETVDSEDEFVPIHYESDEEEVRKKGCSAILIFLNHVHQFFLQTGKSAGGSHYSATEDERSFFYVKIVSPFMKMNFNPSPFSHVNVILQATNLASRDQPGLIRNQAARIFQCELTIFVPIRCTRFSWYPQWIRISPLRGMLARPQVARKVRVCYFNVNVITLRCL